MPKSMKQFNYWKWQDRATVARLLMRIDGADSELKAAALRIMETVVEHDPEELEHKVWSLTDLALLYYKVLGNHEKALKFLDQAITLMESSDEEDFFFVACGEVWVQRIYILYSTGRQEQTIDEVKQRMQGIKNFCTSLENNSYLYFGNLFLAFYEEQHKNFEMAVSYVYEAAKYCNQHIREDVEKIWSNRHVNYEQAYNKMDRVVRGLHGWDA